MTETRSVDPSAPWYVVRTHRKQEFRAEQNLLAGGLDVFLPRIRPPRARRARQRDVLPLFPQYMFVRYADVESLHDVTFTRGIQAVLRVGECLATIDDGVIDFLRSRMDESQIIRVGEPVRPGEQVVIEDGPFAALVGVVERLLPDKERVVVLLTLLRAQVRVEVPTDSVRTVPAAL